MSYKETLTNLKKLGEEHRSKKAFVDAVKKKYVQMGAGAFRVAYMDILNTQYIFKCRHVVPRPGSAFTQEEVNNSNKDEAESYNILVNYFPYLSTFVLPVCYYQVNKNNDVIFMPKVTPIGGEWCEEDADAEGWHENTIEQIKFISETWEDGHYGNIGYLGKPTQANCRVFLMDLNRFDMWDAIACEKIAKLLRQKLDLDLV